MKINLNKGKIYIKECWKKLASKENKIKLIKTKDNYKIKIKFSPSLVDLPKKDKEDLKKMLIHFFRTMIDNCKNFDIFYSLPNFTKTMFEIYSVCDEVKKIFEKTPRILEEAAGFVFFDRKFKYLFADNSKAVNHELMHLCSTYYNYSKKYRIMGFEHAEVGYYSGTAMKEGYTQLLTERYFSEDNSKCYIFEVYIMNILEKIIGKDIMEKFYFTSQRDSLIAELQKYESKDNVDKFIDDFDICFKNDIYNFEYLSRTITEENKKIFEEKKKSILVFLINCIKNKLNSCGYENYDVAFNEMLNKDDWVKNLTPKKKFKEEVFTFNLISEDGFNKILNYLNQEKINYQKQKIK